MSSKQKNLSRRNFTKISSLALGSLPLMSFETLFPTRTPSDDSTIEVHLFSKHLQFLDYNSMAEVTAEMGFDGLDLTVRPNGHVLPAEVVKDLPKAVIAIKKFGLKPTLLTTNVLDFENEEQVTVLETASELGFTHYRTGWLSYPKERTIAESQAIYGQQFKNLEILNKNLGLIGCYQNHAGKHVGAPIWDLLPILSATNNENMGCQYDIRHAVVEGASSWELGLRQIYPYIKSIVIKDFKWGLVGGKWKPVNTPLGEGMVDFKHYFSLLKKYNVNVPVSLHLEYDMGGAEHGAKELSLDKEIVFRHMKKDLSFLRETWQNA